MDFTIEIIWVLRKNYICDMYFLIYLIYFICVFNLFMSFLFYTFNLYF